MKHIVKCMGHKLWTYRDPHLNPHLNLPLSLPPRLSPRLPPRLSPSLSLSLPLGLAMLLGLGFDQKYAWSNDLRPPTPQQSITPGAEPSLGLDAPTDERLTSVEDLSDVHPQDWAYQALKALIERYGTIIGYPDGTFHGDRPLSRAEFAAALKAAIPQVDLSRYATRADLEALRRLMQDFDDELAAVEAKVSRLERLLQPFSDTTKITGEVVLAPLVVAQGDKANRNDPTDSQLSLGSRVNLNLLTDLGGKTILRTGFQASDMTALQRATGTDMARVGFQSDTNNALELSELSLRSRLNSRTTLYAFLEGGGLHKFTETLNPFVGNSSRGSISRFGQRNPIYRQGGNAGAGLSYQLSPIASLDVGYLAGDANEAETGIGNAPYGAIAQLTFELSKTAGVGLSYIRSFNSLDTGTGSHTANDPFDDDSSAIVAHSLGAQAAFGLSKNLALSGWVGWSRATATDLPGDPSASIFNWALTLAVPNLGGEGNLLGFVVGQPPKVTANDFQLKGRSLRDPDTSFHFETFYRLRLGSGISLTPGLMVITAPEHNRDNAPIILGTLRTTFSF